MPKCRMEIQTACWNLEENAKIEEGVQIFFIYGNYEVVETETEVRLSSQRRRMD
jgi:hypothetical protein